jgi:hypothetical protein
MTTHRLLTEAELETIRHWIASLPGAGSNRVPDDLNLLLGHLDAQAAELRRERARVHRLSDALVEVIDLVERGGAEDYRDSVLTRARAALGG